MIRRLKALIYEEEEKEPQIALNHIVPFAAALLGNSKRECWQETPRKMI